MHSGSAIFLVIAPTCIAIAALYVAITQTIARRRRMARAQARAARLYRLAHYDQATGLPNRRLFTEKLLKYLVDAQNNRNEEVAPIGLVYAELRHYRQWVERLGHDRLNRILRILSGQLSQPLRADDTLARLSAEAFILMVPEQGSRSTLAALSALSAQLSTPLVEGGQSFRFQWAIGSSRCPDNGHSTQRLIRAAMTTQHQIGTAAATLAVSSSPRYALAS